MTQTINGIDHVLYLDPYTSTRWNVTNTHIDLYLSDPDILCGPAAIPATRRVGHGGLTKVASDPVWFINKANGKYQVPPVSNAAYGGTISIYANFSHDLANGSLMRYYWLSYAKAGTSTFTPIDTTLSDYRASIVTPPHNFPSPCAGAAASGPTAGMYEVRDREHYWLEEGLGGGGRTAFGTRPRPSWTKAPTSCAWKCSTRRATRCPPCNTRTTRATAPACRPPSHPSSPGTTTSAHGQQAADVRPDHPGQQRMRRDRLAAPQSAELPCDAEQENGRVNSWILEYVKGINLTRHTLGSATYNAGTSPVSVDVNGNAMVAGVTSTCAFALLLRAWSHVRGDLASTTTARRPTPSPSSAASAADPPVLTLANEARAGSPGAVRPAARPLSVAGSPCDKKKWCLLARQAPFSLLWAELSD